MSSSGSRGPPISRYNERNDYNDYNKTRRKNFYNNTSRRDYKSNGLPGSSSLSHSKVQIKSENPSASESSYGAPNRSRYNGSLTGSTGSSRRPYGAGPNVRDNRNSYSSYGMSKGSYSSYNSAQGSNSYYGSYNSYNNFTGSKRDSNDYQSGISGNFYNRDDSWRSERIKSNGDSRLSTSTKPTLSGLPYNSRPNNNSGSLKHSGPGSIDGDYRKDRYENSYQGDSSLSMSGGKWKSTYGLNNRSTLTGSVGSRNFSSKDRMRPYTGSSSLINGKRSDSYYSRNSYNGGNSYNKSVDHYATSNKSRDFVRTKTYSEDEADNDKHISANENDHYSPPQFDEHNKSTNFDVNSEMDIENSKDSDNEKSMDKNDFDENMDENNQKHAHEHEYEHDLEESVNDEDGDREEVEIEEEDEIEVEEDEDEIEIENGEAEVEDQVTNKNKEQIIRDEDTQHNDIINKNTEGNVETTYELAIKDSNEHILKNENDNKKAAKVILSDEIFYPEGCNYPLNCLESKFSDLQKEFESKTKGSDNEISKYSLAKPIKDLYDYPFYQQNYQSYFKNKAIIEDSFITKKKALKKKKLSLWKSYSLLEKTSALERENMDQQLRIVHPVDDEMRREIDLGDIKKQHPVDRQSYEGDISPPVTNNNRRNRRHGDLVTTEAEFQEILQSLGKEDDENPLVKAERVAAKIPDYILDPVERNVTKFMDSNNIVIDKSKWAERVKLDFEDNFSQSEHELFCEGFCLFPKRFGAISRHIGGLRTPHDCVVHYYTTKKTVNYKQLLAHYRKRASKKAGRRNKQSRSRNVSQNQTPVATPTIDKSVNDMDDFILSNVGNTSIDSLSEEVFTDTGRRKRAAAPTFDTNGKKSENEPEDPQRKKQKKKKEELIEISDRAESSNDNKDVDLNESPKLTHEKELGDLNNNMELNDSDLKNRRKGISSYWSITETNSFPDLLKEHGTKWITIADKLTTKTATMVRNYYQRNAEKNGWNIIAEEADAKLEAKFAALIGSKVDSTESTTIKDNVVTMNNPVVPVGTFQHPGVTIESSRVNYDDNTKPHIPSIKSFLTDNSPQTVPSIITKQVSPPQRSSIMSLLNSESSPIKPEPEKEIILKPSITSKESIFKNILNTDSPSDERKGE